MSQRVAHYTKEGLAKIKKDLTALKTKGRTDIARQIAEARDKGDLSENAEYDAAKDAQGHLEARIARLEEVVGNARVIDESKIDLSVVSVLSKTTVRNKLDNSSHTYVLVAEEEADITQNKISVLSPIARGILGKKKGDTAYVQTPSGSLEFEILSIDT